MLLLTIWCMDEIFCISQQNKQENRCVYLRFAAAIVGDVAPSFPRAPGSPPVVLSVNHFKIIVFENLYKNLYYNFQFSMHFD